MSVPLLKYRQPIAPQDILTEAMPARLYTEGSGLNLARAALFGVGLDKVSDIVELLRLYRGGRPNSLIGGGPMGWSWYNTLASMATDHHGDMTAFGGTHHAHGQLGGVGIDDHHARDHATRHHSGGADALALGSIAGNLTDAQHGSRTQANAHAHSHLSGIGVNDHHAQAHDINGADHTNTPLGVTKGGTGLSSIDAGGILYASAANTLSRIAPSAANQVLRSTGANALQIAALVANDIPNLDAAKITSGRFGKSRLEWTANKLLKGAGAGADPTEIDVPGVPIYYELTGAASSTAGNATWEDWDISAQIPVGVIEVDVLIDISANTSAITAGVRANGSALNRYFSHYTSDDLLYTTNSLIMTAKVDANRIIERYATNKYRATFSVIGYRL